MEDFKKNFVLLSTIAKEKKYAQEYLGLLARRGDIGSIRIGKRWYTKIEWFSEFLADTDARKTETKTVAFPAMPIEEKIERKEKFVAKEAEPFEKIVEHPIRIVKSFEKSQKKNINLVGNAETVPISVSVQKVSIRKDPIQGKDEIRIPEREEVEIILPIIINQKPVPQKPSVAEKKNDTVNLKINRNAKPVFRRTTVNIPEMKKAVPEKRIQPMPVMNSPVMDNWLERAKDPSPNFVPVESRIEFFPKFAFSMSIVLLLVLLIQFGWVYKNEIKGMVGIKSGTVAGAQDSKVDLNVAKNSSADYLGKQEEKVKESISLSRVLIRAAVEKNNAEIK